MLICIGSFGNLICRSAYVIQLKCNIETTQFTVLHNFPGSGFEFDGADG